MRKTPVNSAAQIQRCLQGPAPTENTRPSPALALDAKFHFVLADRLKGAARHASELSEQACAKFRDELERETGRLRAETPFDLDLIIGGKDAARLRRYNAATWTKEVVSLESCLVPDGMGGKMWVRGLRVPEAAAAFLKREGEKSRVWLMKSRTRLFLECLPIIVLGGDGLE